MKGTPGSAFESRVEAAAQPYRSSGPYAWHFARGKLRHDPMFRHLADAPPGLDGGRVVDLGCGQGVLFAWLSAAPGGCDAQFDGMELSPRRVEIARRALGTRARIDCCDIRHARIPRASLIVIMDVLLYMSAAEQSRVLENVVDALDPGGTLLLREADREAGARFHITEWGERISAAHRGGLWHALHYRGVGEWRALLESLGLAVAVQSMSAGTPFANVLYTARKR